MREFEVKPQLEKKLIKLFKKDKKTYDKLMKKIKEILDSKDVEHHDKIYKQQHL